MPRVSYLDRILIQLEKEKEPVGVYDLMVRLNIPQYKVIYVTQAIRDGLFSHKIEKIVTPGETREYVGHAYRII